MKSTYLRTAILNAIGNHTALDVAQAYASLHSADPGLTGTSELPNADSYARVAVSFGAAGSGNILNDAISTFGPASDDWPEAGWVGLWDSGTYGAGNFLGSAPLGTWSADLADWLEDLVAFLETGGALDLETWLVSNPEPVLTLIPKTVENLDTASFAIGAFGARER